MTVTPSVQVASAKFSLSHKLNMISYLVRFSLYYKQHNASMVGAGLAPALNKSDRKGHPYMFRNGARM